MSHDSFSQSLIVSMSPASSFNCVTPTNSTMWLALYFVGYWSQMLQPYVRLGEILEKHHHNLFEITCQSHPYMHDIIGYIDL